MVQEGEAQAGISGLTLKNRNWGGSDQNLEPLKWLESEEQGSGEERAMGIEAEVCMGFPCEPLTQG